MVSLKAPKTFEVVEAILEQKKFTQLALSKQVSASFGIVNRTTRWLESKNYVKKTGKFYELRDPAGILSSIALFRDMKSLVVDEVTVSLEPRQIKDLLPPNQACYCLETALEEYSGYFRSNRVCVYSDKKDVPQLMALLQNKKGPGIQVVFYEEKPPVKGKKTTLPESNDRQAKEGSVNRRYTPRARTVIDLVCDNKSYIAQDLFMGLWGIKLG